MTLETLFRSGASRTPSGALLVLLTIVACVPADPHGREAARSGAAVDAARAAGAELAHNGLSHRGIPACTVCHGPSGEGSATAGFPRLAAQPAPYLEHQLDAFANGQRVDPAMSPIARRLTAVQRRDLALFYASRRASVLPSAALTEAARGEQLALHGDPALAVPACSNCHGWNGAGQPPLVPFLAGQHARYLERALRAWRSGERDSDPRRQMPAIARRLAEEDLAALAIYFAALPPPWPQPDMQAGFSPPYEVGAERR
jgi:cytochrome c553